MEDTSCADYGSYLDYLHSHPQEMDDLIKALTIRVSNFFRNPLVFELLDAFILPELYGTFRHLKAWSLGCASGEEPYSLAIMAKEAAKRHLPQTDISILGTDLCEGAIENALKGEYRDEEMLETKKRYLDSYFTKLPIIHNSGDTSTRIMGDNVYRIGGDIRAMVRFECGDIVSKLTGGKLRGGYNLVLCRNVLIYLNRPLQSEIVSKLAGLIDPNGFLVLGETETLPEDARNLFEQEFPGVKIFRRKAAAP